MLLNNKYTYIYIYIRTFIYCHLASISGHWSFKSSKRNHSQKESELPPITLMLFIGYWNIHLLAIDNQILDLQELLTVHLKIWQLSERLTNKKEAPWQPVWDAVTLSQSVSATPGYTGPTLLYIQHTHVKTHIVHSVKEMILNSLIVVVWFFWKIYQFT